MPSKNVVREDADDTYYHIYNRCISGNDLFKDDSDYIFFLSLLKRYLQREKTINKTNGMQYENFYNRIELLTFCLMPTHFHLLVHQVEAGTMSELMKAIANSYTKHFNKKYSRRGPLFQGVYKASRISTDEYLTHVSRYIHLNAVDYDDWSWSSLPYYKGNFSSNWVRPQFVLDLFDNNIPAYLEFVADYEEMHAQLEEMHHQLADGLESLL